MTRPRHLGRALVSQLDAEEDDGAAEILRDLLQHLAEECPECGEGAHLLGLQGVSPAAVEATAEETPDYGPIVARALAAVRRVLAELVEVPKSAVETLSDLLALEPAARRLAAAELGPWHDPQVIEELLLYTRRQAADDGENLEELARLAVALVERMDLSRVPSGLVQDFLAQAWALVAQELLAQGGTSATDAALLHAEGILGSGTGDPLAAIQVRLVRMFWRWRLGDLIAAEQDLDLLHGLTVLLKCRGEEGELWLWKHLLLLGINQPGPAQAAFHQAMVRLGPEAGAIAFRRVNGLHGRLGLP